jgi:hypothetical protein
VKIVVKNICLEMVYGNIKKCNQEKEHKKSEPSDKELMCMLIKQNSELIKEHSDIKELILEIVKTIL